MESTNPKKESMMEIFKNVELKRGYIDSECGLRYLRRKLFINTKSS